MRMCGNYREKQLKSVMLYIYQAEYFKLEEHCHIVRNSWYLDTKRKDIGFV